MSRGVKLLLFAVFVVIGPAAGALTGTYSFVGAERFSFCASCHTMTPWVRDIEDPNSRSLAALHYRNHFIPHDQCYTCHVNYGFLGPIDAKIGGVRHVAVYYFGHPVPRKIKLYAPFPNRNCLGCHAGAAPFLRNPAHHAVMGLIVADRMKCAVCHEPIHTPQFETAARPIPPRTAMAYEAPR
ncbi:MAG: NapC/NirT family cytochrome c [Candidatus Binataceae bacterium]